MFSSETANNSKKQSTAANTSTAVGRQQSTGQPNRNVIVDLPNVQSKETILTEFDYNHMFTKRKVESNWSKYDELPEDEDNEQMLAANFEEMLLGPKTIGSHFTFSSERHWDNLDVDHQFQQSHGIHEQLFKLDLNLVKNGIGALPFDVRLGYPEAMFNDSELADITSRVGCFDRFVRKAEIAGRNDVDLISEFELIDAKSKMNASANVSDEESSKSAKERINLPYTKIVPSSGSVANDPTSTLLCSIKTTTVAGEKLATKLNVAKPAAAIASQSIENIQGWLDDILNNG